MGGQVSKYIIVELNEVSCTSNLFRRSQPDAKVGPHEGGKTVRAAQQSNIIYS